MDAATATATCAVSPSPGATPSQPPPRANPEPEEEEQAKPCVAPPALAAAAPLSAQRPPLARRRATGGADQPQSASTVDDSDNGESEGGDSVDKGGGGGGGGGETRSGGVRKNNRGRPSRAEALREFLTSVRDEILELVAAFQVLSDAERCFAAFKSLWLERRLSGMFHVEFWDSTPSDTHHAILQVALELLVDAITTTDTAVVLNDDDDHHETAVLGHWFALYCAYCVQVSEPKIKITVDVAAWQSLTQLSGLLAQQLTTPVCSRPAREALAMLRRLEHEQDAFLKCLGGSVAEFRLHPHKQAMQQRQLRTDPQTALSSSSSSLPELVVPPRREDEMEDMVMQLEALSAQYNASLQQLSQVEIKTDHGGDVDSIAVATTTTATSAMANHSQRGRGGGAARGRGRGRGRGAAAPTFLRKSRATETASGGIGGIAIGGGDRIALDAGLWTENRATENEAWLARLRQSLLPASTVASAVASRAATSGRNRVSVFLEGDGATSDVDAALLALEQELVREEQEQVDYHQRPTLPLAPPPPPPPPQARPVTTTPPPSRMPLARPSSTPVRRTARAMSIVSSGHESDGLDELEAELTRDVASASAQQAVSTRKPVIGASATATVTKKKATPPMRTTLVQSQPRPRTPSVFSIDTESDGMAELEAELTRETVRPSPQPRPRSAVPTATPSTRNARAAVSRVTRRYAASIASTGDESDGLADLEAEPTRETRPAQPPQRTLLLPPRPVATTAAATATAPPRPPRVTRTRAYSIASSSQQSDGLAELEEELKRELHPVVAASRPQHQQQQQQQRQQQSGTCTPTRSTVPPPIAPPQPVERTVQPSHAAASRYTRRSSRFSDVSSVDELNLLQQELDAAVAPTRTPAKAPARVTSSSRKRPAAAAATVTATTTATATATATTSLSTSPARAPPPPKRLKSAASPGLPLVRRSRRLSDASSVMTEGDAELAALQAELSRDPSVARPQATAATAAVTVVSVTAMRPAPQTAVAVTTATTTTAMASATRLSSRKRSRTMSDLSAMTESDDELKQLQAELAMNAQSKPAVPVKKPTRAKTTRTSTVAALAGEETGATKSTPKPKPAPKPRKPRAVTTAAAAAKGQQAMSEKSARPPRKPRQPKAKPPPATTTTTAATAITGTRQKPPPAPPAPPAPPPTAPTGSRSARLSSRRSVASSYDSDGLDELEKELQAGLH